MVLGDAAWADLCALAQPHRRPAGTVLLRQGEQSTHVLALASGSVTVSLRGSSGNPTLLAFRHVGELLGDLGVLTRTPRTATVTAATFGRAPLAGPMTAQLLWPAKDGWISAPDGPGLGITLNDEFVKKYRVAESER